VDASAGAASGGLSPLTSGSAGALPPGLSTGSTLIAVSGDSPSSVVLYGLTSAFGSAACRRGPGRRPRRPGRRRSFMNECWVMSDETRVNSGRGVTQPRHSSLVADSRARGVRVSPDTVRWNGNGNDRAGSTTARESPSGAESARDTGDVHLGEAMARRVTPIPSGCHSPEPRAVRATQKVTDRCTSIAPSPHSRKHICPRRAAPGPPGALRHQLPFATCLAPSAPLAPLAPSLPHPDPLTSRVTSTGSQPGTMRPRTHPRFAGSLSPSLPMQRLTR